MRGRAQSSKPGPGDAETDLETGARSQENNNNNIQPSLRTSSLMWGKLSKNVESDKVS